MEKPKIRPVEAFPADQNGQTYICLRDPSGISPTPLMIGMGAYFLVTLFDGANTKTDLQAAFTKRFGESLPPDHLDGLIAALDQGFFLESPAYTARMDAVREEFNRNPQRPAALAGICYENEPIKLRREIEAFFRAPGGPGKVFNKFRVSLRRRRGGCSGRSRTCSCQHVTTKYTSVRTARASKSVSHCPVEWVHSPSGLTAPLSMPRRSTDEAAAASPHRSGKSWPSQAMTDPLDRFEVTPFSAICTIEIAVTSATACSSFAARA